MMSKIAERWISQVGRVAATVGIFVGASEVAYDGVRAIQQINETSLDIEKAAPMTPLDRGDGWVVMAASVALRKYLAREEGLEEK